MRKHGLSLRGAVEQTSLWTLLALSLDQALVTLLLLQLCLDLLESCELEIALLGLQLLHLGLVKFTVIRKLVLVQLLNEDATVFLPQQAHHVVDQVDDEELDVGLDASLRPNKANAVSGELDCVLNKADYFVEGGVGKACDVAVVE